MDDGYDGLDAIAVSKDCYEELEGSTSSKTVDSDSTGYEDASTRNPMFYSALDAERQRYERAFEAERRDSLYTYIAVPDSDSSSSPSMVPGYTDEVVDSRASQYTAVMPSDSSVGKNNSNNDDDDDDDGYIAAPSEGSSSSSPFQRKEKKKVGDWNAEFQRISELEDKESAEAWSELAALAHDFVNAAQHYASIIISEMQLPEHLRTIKGATTIGGTAGGLKFIAGGLLFKFASDPNLGSESAKRHLYSGNDVPNLEAAAKALGQELKGLAGYYWSGVKELSFPLMAVIDLMGFRILSISLLPISKETLCYGSDSGGRIANNNNLKMNSLMERAGKHLNLAPHYVGKNRALIYGPGDIEGHVGFDGRYYVLDYGRVYPPEAPVANANPGKIFYQLLRPELVRQQKIPLCSDAFTGFCRYDGKMTQYCAQVSQVTNHLYFKIIPEFAEYLGEIGYELEFVSMDILEFRKRVNLVVDLHRNGINVRHLGRLRFVSTSPLVRKVLLSECVFRVLKNSVRSQMRELLSSLLLPRASPFQQLLVKTYNSVLQNEEEFWEVFVAGKLREKFGDRVLLGTDVTAANHEKLVLGKVTMKDLEKEIKRRSIKEQVDVSYVLTKLNDYFGGILPLELWKILNEKDPEIMLNDFGAFNAKVKHLGLVHFAQGKALAIRGMEDKLETLKKGSNEVMRRLRFLREARENLGMVLYTTPDSVATLILLAKIDLFPINYFVENDDWHLMERCLHRAFEHLKLAKLYRSEAEAATLMVIACVKHIQYLSSHVRRHSEYYEMFKENVKLSLRRDPHSLDQFVYEVLREKSARGRQFLLSEIDVFSKGVPSLFYCNHCSKNICFRSPLNMRYRCTQCFDFDLCEKCYPKRMGFHSMDHVFEGLNFEAHKKADRKHGGFSSSQEESMQCSISLANIVKRQSEGMTTLNISETTISEKELIYLDLSEIQTLDCSGCRRITHLPENLPNLRFLDVSNCSKLAEDSSSILQKYTELREIRAKGIVGRWNEESDDIANLKHLTHLDLQRRSLVERFCFWSETLEKFTVSNASHVGGYVVSKELKSCEFQGSELVSRIKIVNDLLPYEQFCHIRLSVSGVVHLEEKEEKDQDVSNNSSGSLLAKFLRQNSGSSKLKKPSQDAFLEVRSPVLINLNLNTCLNCEDFHLNSQNLTVLNMFRMKRFKISTWSAPNLTTFYCSQWIANSAMLFQLIDVLPASSLKNLYLCEMDNMETQHIDHVFSTKPNLVYANFYKSGSSKSIQHVALKNVPKLREISLEAIEALETFQCQECPALERVILRRCPKLKSQRREGGCPKMTHVYGDSARVLGITPLEPVQIYPFPFEVELGVIDYEPPKEERRVKK